LRPPSLGIVVWNEEGRKRFRAISAAARIYAEKNVEAGSKGRIFYRDLLEVCSIHGISWEHGELPYDEYMEMKENVEKGMMIWAATTFQARMRGFRKRKQMGIQGASSLSASESKAMKFKTSFLKKMELSKSGFLESPRNAGSGLASPRGPHSIEIEMTSSQDSPTGNILASPRPNAGLSSPQGDPNAAAIEITEVRNLFRDRAQKRKQKKGSMAPSGASPRSPGRGNMVVQL